MPGAPRTMTGILKRAAFPGELAALYRLEGRAIDRRPYVLFASEESLRWPNYASALQLFVLALGALLFAGVFRWRHSRMITRFTPQPAPATGITPA